MNEIWAVKTIYVRSSRTLEFITVTNGQGTRIFYLYNYECFHYRLFDSKIEVRKFFNCEDAQFLEFSDEDVLDSYLMNC